MKSYADLLDAIDLVLHTGIYDGHSDKTAQIAIALCELVRSELDSQQIAAVDAAKAYWRTGNSERERLRHSNVISDRLDRSNRSLSSSERQLALDRLVFCTLNTNTGLSVLAGEYLAELAEVLGLPVEAVGKAFAQHVPDFS